MTIQQTGPGRHPVSWLVVRLIGLLIALLVLPVLIVLNLFLYLVIVPAAVQAIIELTTTL
jgi:hypothetical protein